MVERLPVDTRDDWRSFSSRIAFRMREMTNMATGKKPASNAGKELGSSKSTKAEKTVAGSALSQAPKGKGGRGK